jgi:uncharacterized protein YjaG (DUF416 family)
MTMNLDYCKTDVEKVYKLKFNKNFKDLQNAIPDLDFSVLYSNDNLIRICEENEEHLKKIEKTLEGIIDHTTQKSEMIHTYHQTNPNWHHQGRNLTNKELKKYGMETTNTLTKMKKKNGYQVLVIKSKEEIKGEGTKLTFKTFKVKVTKLKTS